MKRGRKSDGDLTVIPGMPGQRPEPPPALTERQAEIWRGIVATKPPDYFGGDTQPLLVEYCRVVATCEHLSEIIEQQSAGEFSIDRWRHLQPLHSASARETRLMLTLARSLRLTQQSQMKAEKAGRIAAIPQGPRPWDR